MIMIMIINGVNQKLSCHKHQPVSMHCQKILHPSMLSVTVSTCW